MLAWDISCILLQRTRNRSELPGEWILRNNADPSLIQSCDHDDDPVDSTPQRNRTSGKRSAADERFRGPGIERGNLTDCSAWGRLRRSPCNQKRWTVTFFIYVRKPGDYDETECGLAGRLYPGWRRPVSNACAVSFHARNLMNWRHPPCWVGISYGGLGFANGNYRSTDYNRTGI